MWYNVEYIYYFVCQSDDDWAASGAVTMSGASRADKHLCGLIRIPINKSRFVYNI